MSAFTEEQQAILYEALHHVWSRMESLHDDLNEDSLRLASAVKALGDRGLLSPAEIDRISAELHVQASISSQPGMAEQEITAAILGGDVEAFRRAQDAE
jgi:hypothetical protein